MDANVRMLSQELLSHLNQSKSIRHRIDTETRRCECGAPACKDCLLCSATCDCATKIENTPIFSLRLDGAFANERFTGEIE